MSFMQNMPAPKPKVKYVNFGGTKSEFGNGTHYFVAMFGKNMPNGLDITNIAEYSEAQYPPIPERAVSFWCNHVPEGQNKYIKWLYTGENDPSHELGLALPVKQQSLERFKEIWGGKGFQSQQPQTNWFLPVLVIERDAKKKTYNLENAQPLVLIVSQSLMQKISASALSTNILDSEDPSMFGRIFSLTKDMTNKDLKEQYKAEVMQRVITESDATAMPETSHTMFVDAISGDNELFTNAFTGIERTFNTVNGGKYDGDHIRQYITGLTNMSWENFVAAYNVLPSVELAVSEQTAF